MAQSTPVTDAPEGAVVAMALEALGLNGEAFENNVASSQLKVKPSVSRIYIYICIYMCNTIRNREAVRCSLIGKAKARCPNCMDNTEGLFNDISDLQSNARAHVYIVWSNHE